jgi:2-oxoisovalerate dehydrogenase E1 component
LTTPISEAAIVGIANGLALKGTPAVVEIMFGDFVTLAFDQLVNHAAKFRHMYGTERSFPLVVRMPMGGGRGYGPTHSQSLEKHLAGVPGTQLFVLHGRTHVARFYADLLGSVDSPSIVIENKLLYSRSASDDFPAGYALLETAGTFPTSMLRPNLKADITLVAIGGQSSVAEQAAARLRDEDELVCEILLPLRLYPLDTGPILESLRRTKRLVIVEEGTRGYDLAAELAVSVLEHWEESVPFRMKRLAAREIALPSALPLERQVLPSVDELCRLCRELYSA